MIPIVPWKTFTADNVKARMSARELDVYESTATVDDEAPIDRMDAVVSQILDSFRGAIRANPHITSMGAVGTLPDFCIHSASTMARNSLIGLNPVSEGMTDPRRDEQREAERFLRELRNLSPRAFEEDPVASDSIGSSYGGSALLDF